MATVVAEPTSQQIIVKPWWEKLRPLVIGLAVGVIWWALLSLLDAYVVEPIACGNNASIYVCNESFGVSGSIAAIFSAILGSILLVRILHPRPVMIPIASAIVLWGLASLADGLGWPVVLVASAVLYSLCYYMFGLIGKISDSSRSTFVTIITVLMILVVVTWL